MSSAGTVHVVGAGLAGLAAAVALVAQGRPVALYEAAPHAGGRCRSFFDSELGCRIDNGNHLLLSGNSAALSYIEEIGALDTFEPLGKASIPFLDLETGERWSLRPNNGRLPWWFFARSRRVPGTRAADYFGALKLRNASPSATVAERLDTRSVLFRRLWEPLTVAALNTSAADGSARLFGHLLAETLGRGGAACRPLLPKKGLSESLIDPALTWLAARGCAIRLGTRLRGLGIEDRITHLDFDNAAIRLDTADSVVLAVPAAVATRLVPGLLAPDDHAPIVNAHFRVAPPAKMPPLIGIIGGTAEWIFRKATVVSVTVSAADRLVDRPADELGERLWRDVAQACGLPVDPQPAGRIVKERRATFRASPNQLRRRPPTETRWANLRVAGDYVDTGLPATIEGAIRSGFAAAGRAGFLPASGRLTP